MTVVSESLQLLLREDPSLQYLLNEDHSIHEFARQSIASDLDAKLALVESMSVKVSRTSPEAISQQFRTTNMQIFQEQSRRLLQTSQFLKSNSTRVEHTLSQQAQRLQKAVTILKNATTLANIVKQLSKLHFERQKEFDLEDRRDLLQAAASVATMRNVLEHLEQENIHWNDPKNDWRTLLRQRQDAIRERLPNSVLTTVLRVHYEWDELPKAVWEKVERSIAEATPNNVSLVLDQMQFLQKSLETQTNPQATTYLNIVWNSVIPKQFERYASHKNIVYIVWYGYCVKQRNANWNSERYQTVRSMTREMLQRRSSHQIATQSNTDVGILGGFNEHDDDHDDDESPVTWTVVASSGMMSTNVEPYDTVQNTIYWKIFLDTGLERLEQDFLKSVQKRLIGPVQLMFPSNTLLLDETAAVGLPSKFDLQRFDETIRNELKLGMEDPSMIPIVAERVTLAVAEFCQRATQTLMRGTYLSDELFQMTSGLQHDRKIVAILFALYTYLTKAPETVFGTVGQPPKDCAVALTPAISTIDTTILTEIIQPVVTELKQHIHMVVSRPYGPEFVQTHVATALERLADSILKKVPPMYASRMATDIAQYTVLAFITTVSLIRPMTEHLRLQITQDLADLELAVQQLLGSSNNESWLNSKAYVELRAVRQMLYWTGLEQSSAKTAPEVAKSILREMWLSDVRPSTVFHYLFSFAPSALSAPYHVANLTVSAYVEHIVANEETTWIMVCCDRYEQRGASAAAADGDSRVAQIVLALGQELLRRRGRNHD